MKTLFLILLTASLSAQVKTIKRYADRPDISTKIISPMKFTPEVGTIYVGICADSLQSSYMVMLFADFPDKKDYNIDLGFPDGSLMTLTSSFHKSGYSEYQLSESSLQKLKNNKFDYISFNLPNLQMPCAFIKTPDYFSGFLKEL